MEDVKNEEKSCCGDKKDCCQNEAKHEKSCCESACHCCGGKRKIIKMIVVLIVVSIIFSIGVRVGKRDGRFESDNNRGQGFNQERNNNTVGGCPMNRDGVKRCGQITDDAATASTSTAK